MHEIAFLISPYDTERFGFGEPIDCVEPIIDGVSLVELAAREDHEYWFTARDAESALHEWRALLDDGCPHRTRLLLDDSPIESTPFGLSATVECRAGVVTWSDLAGSSRPGPMVQGETPYRDLGPFEFAQAAFVEALDHPQRANVPLRSAPDLRALAAGVPREPLAWLYAMTLAFDRDLFFMPFAEDSLRETCTSGLRSLRQHGVPVEEEHVRAWATERRFTPEAIDRIVAGWREV